MINVPAGKRLYLRTSQRTSLLGSSVNGSLNMQTGMRYMSLLEPSAWYVLEPSKFHSGTSDGDEFYRQECHQSILSHLSPCRKGKYIRRGCIAAHFIYANLVLMHFWFLPTTQFSVMCLSSGLKLKICLFSTGRSLCLSHL